MSLRHTLLRTMAVLAMLLIGTLSTYASNHIVTAEIWDVNGRKVGTAVFTPMTGGDVQIEIKVAGYNPVAGDHGVHIHDAGRCELPTFATMGGHWNPAGTGTPHGSHKGDLPNMPFFADGSGYAKFTMKNFAMAELMDANGSSISIHANPDDHKTAPSGNSGAIIGCGVIFAPGAAAPAPARPTTAPARPTTAPARPTTAPAMPTPAPAAPTAPATTSAAAPKLIGPVAGWNCYEAGGCHFEWTYDGTLAANQYFQVQMFLPTWQEGRGIHPPTKEMSFHASRDTYAHFTDVCYGNDDCLLYWAVVVVEWDGNDPSKIGRRISISPKCALLL